jgi:integrase
MGEEGRETAEESRQEMNPEPKKIRGVYEKVVGSGIWWVRFADATGKVRREKVGNRGAAITLYRKRRTEVLQRKKLPENFRHAAVSFATLCTDAIAHCAASNAAKSSYELKLKVDEMLPVFGSRPAEEITKQEIVGFLTKAAKDREWKPSSENRWQAAFSLIFRVGIDNEKIERNPAARIRRKTENNGRVRFMDDDEERRIRQAIPGGEKGRFIAAFDLSIHTGMRSSEQFSLRWNQITPVDGGRFLVSLPKTKNGGSRHIPLNAEAMAALQILTEFRTSDTSPVFPGRSGVAVKGSRGWFKQAVERAGVQSYTWHCHRHTFASRLVMAGVDLRTVGELLGHRSPAMTYRYAHLAPAHTLNAVDRLVKGATDTPTSTSFTNAA